MRQVELSLGKFVSLVTADMDDMGFYESDIHCFLFDEATLWFTIAQLEMVMDVVRGVFYRCYGGWNISFTVEPNGLVTGKISFIPACAHGFAGH